jgi:hypothetical protein
MVGSIFANLSPFVQFIGRVMRAIVQNEPRHPLNEGVVVFHVGANVAPRWQDFRAFSEADQEFFRELLPEIENIQFDGTEPLDRMPGQGGGIEPIEVLEETRVAVHDMPLMDDEGVRAAIELLAARGVSAEQYEMLRRRQPQRQEVRRARRGSLSDTINTRVGGFMAQHSINGQGRTLDRTRRNPNMAFLISEVNRRVGQRVGRPTGERAQWTMDELDQAHDALDDVLAELARELGYGSA